MDAPSAALTERRTAATPLKFSKILWATDFSSSSLASLPYVVAFSHRYQARVYLAHVLVPHAYPLVSPEAVPYLDRLRQAASKLLSGAIQFRPTRSSRTGRSKRCLPGCGGGQLSGADGSARCAARNGRLTAISAAGRAGLRVLQAIFRR